MRRLVILLAAILPAVSIAQTGADLQRIADWVQQSGNDETLNGPAAKELGFGDGEPVPIKVAGFLLRLQEIAYGFGVVQWQGHREFAIYRNTPSSRVQWRVNEAGERLVVLDATSAPPVVHVQDLHAFEEQYRDTLRFFLGEMPK